MSEPVSYAPAATDDALDRQLFRDALSRFPSGVTIVTTTDSDGRWWGFMASAFCSVSWTRR